MTNPVAPAEPWRAFALPLDGGNVLLGRRAAGLVLLLIARLERSGSGDGGALTSELRQLERVLRISAASTPVAAVGHADVRTNPVGSDSTHDTPTRDLVTIKEAATMLHLSERQARRLAADDQLGDVTTAGRAKLLNRLDVEAAAHLREGGHPR